MKVKNYIFDFEKNKNGQAMPINDYFEEMFGAWWEEKNGIKKYSELSRQFFYDELDNLSPPKNAEQKLHIRTVPARVYLKEYSFNHTNDFNSQNKNYIYWVIDGSPYVDQKLEDYLLQENGGILITGHTN